MIREGVHELQIKILEECGYGLFESIILELKKTTEYLS
jgi:hypothetical protein